MRVWAKALKHLTCCIKVPLTHTVLVAILKGSNSRFLVAPTTRIVPLAAKIIVWGMAICNYEPHYQRRVSSASLQYPNVRWQMRLSHRFEVNDGRESTS